MAKTVIDLKGNKIIADEFVPATGPVANITPVATADASDPATTQALANANKAKINELIAALQG